MTGKRLALRIPCPNPIIGGDVWLATSSWQHIVDNHPEVDFPDLYETLGDPHYVHADARRKDAYIIVGKRTLTQTSHSMRVSVKTGLPDGNFVSTAFYSSDPIPTTMVWAKDGADSEGGENDE
ncbi:hypothetical protein [Gluconobacter roseus]|uniref:Phage-Barnase-EndoU-ColicinE5/D-RelE like nuclease 3 domain-containing protein n=1 Tax=Gluconobacter roseus NBRC 3990 TaxID=1307950 RepID=A0A4Y3M9G6_9PROT|nr:hypothetical protein [Gluconobacter roseus]GBR43291.1 hypothetical protein AA3990_0377 [Gluconobacter roseus NBRC 3990]GEB03911.1 hypothetical protein GRO01_14870 [Gluconobacter roseus NBRC 3990]GLP94364.1 hypothetical protein GCM10007871_23420 [Gluconobacter roseus NBRC 3990]